MGKKREITEDSVALSTLTDAKRRTHLDEIFRDLEKIRKTVRRPRGLTTRQLIEEGRRY